MGLLDEGQACPNQHGPMERQQGVWALSQVQPQAATAFGSQSWVHTGGLYAVHLYRCATCGLVVMRDKD